jgi:hypothetical protein
MAVLLLFSQVTVYIRLTKKFADYLDGVDVTQYTEGDLIELDDRIAWLLVAEGWAEPVGPFESEDIPAEFLDHVARFRLTL